MAPWSGYCGITFLNYLLLKWIIFTPLPFVYVSLHEKEIVWQSFITNAWLRNSTVLRLSRLYYTPKMERCFKQLISNCENNNCENKIPIRYVNKAEMFEMQKKIFDELDFFKMLLIWINLLLSNELLVASGPKVCIFALFL